MKKAALLIGINDYFVLNELRYARQDAESFADVLQSRCGFSESEITLMTCRSSGATRATSRFIEHAMADLTKCRNLDLLIFGFWGHGFAPMAGQRYLCGIDTVEKELERSAVSLDLAKAKLAQVGAMNTLLLLDCCQNRPAGRAAGAAVLEEGAELQFASMARDIQAAYMQADAVDRIPTVAIMNSCREGQKAYEWDDRKHGVFTSHLLDGLKSGKTSITQLSTFVCDRTPSTVRKLHREKQIPWFTIEGRGDILLSEGNDQSVADVALKPATAPPRHKEPVITWWIVGDKGEQTVNESQLGDMIRSGKIGRDTEVWRKGLAGWIPVGQVEELKALFPPERVQEIGITPPPRKAELPDYVELDCGKSMIIKLKLIPSGEFMMGSPDGKGEDDEHPRHRVEITEPFYMGVYPVTQAQYEAVMGGNPSQSKGFENPVDSVSWYDANKFCEELSVQTGRKTQLPSEAQWEYACRAGTTMAYSFGDDDSQLGRHAWYIGNGGGKTHPIDKKKPNPWGLYDIHGNVCEWCADLYAGSYENVTSVDPTEPSNGSYRVLRGGSWSSHPGYCRSAHRGWTSLDDRYSSNGFRIVLDSN